MKIFKTLFVVLFISGTIASDLKNSEYIQNATSHNVPDIFINTNITDDPALFQTSRTVLNGKKMNVNVEIKNLKNETLVLESFSIRIFDTNFSLQVINLGDIKKRIIIPGLNSTRASFYFSTELAENDYGLTILAKIRRYGIFFTYVAYNSTITVKEPEYSFFNFQTIFLYIILAGLIIGPYLIFQKWIYNIYQKKRKNSKKKISEKKEPEKILNLHYDENWIPEQHLKNRTGTSKKL
ncbi:hypothetical protein PNEG_01635 [Pneumocystis murina B123]|uniref:Uncharacterized protein n=1 Tax=Pneumocystis murina (strain B123) TaxID=1069680 RepID=M7NNV8_PNEMU|nr:hypothetical protein PNEG_01635 [Pneumocystis murina B123]EMR10383.1 hypothetical protein PNEG_01635 [Pneumocystis murina B123]